jgi:hypothetical protein
MEFTVEEKPANFDASYRPPRYQGYGDNFRCECAATCCAMLQHQWQVLGRPELSVR